MRPVPASHVAWDIGGIEMTVALLLLWLALFAAGDTPIGRGMRRWLVEWPAARLAGLHRGAVVTWLVLGAIGAVCFWLLEEEGLQLFGMALPELAGWMTAFEIGSLVDALAMGLLVASSVRVGAVRTWVLRRLGVARRSKRARRTGARPASRAANDDEDGARFARAA